MTYRLHNRLGSGGFVVQATLEAAGIDFDYEPIKSLPNQPVGTQIQTLNPWGQVPILELDDGTRITETAAILACLAHIEPSFRQGPTLWIDDFPSFLRWSVFLAVNVYEGVLRWNYPQRYFTRLSEESRVEFQEADNAHALMTHSVRDAARARVHDAFRCIEEETAEHAFLLSDRLSPCDIFLAMLYAWFNQKPDLPKCTWITTQVATHDIIRPIWAKNFDDRLDFKWHEL
ncbi:MAG: glutathione S-transferase [Pseudomonadota bacterium]